MGAGSDDPAYLSRTFEETMSLLEEARHLFELVRDRLPDNPYAKMRFHCEAMRVTCRLTQSMAWLLAQKAVNAGDIDAELMATSAKYRVGAENVCDVVVYHSDPTLPPWMGGLLERSHAIYQRVRRLDSQIQQCADGEIDPHNRFPYLGLR